MPLLITLWFLDSPISLSQVTLESFARQGRSFLYRCWCCNGSRGCSCCSGCSCSCCTRNGCSWELGSDWDRNSILIQLDCAVAFGEKVGFLVVDLLHNGVQVKSSFVWHALNRRRWRVRFRRSVTHYHEVNMNVRAYICCFNTLSTVCTWA